MKLNHQSEKYCENVNQSDVIFQCPEDICHAYFGKQTLQQLWQGILFAKQ